MTDRQYSTTLSLLVLPPLVAQIAERMGLDESEATEKLYDWNAKLHGAGAKRGRVMTENPAVAKFMTEESAEEAAGTIQLMAVPR